MSNFDALDFTIFNEEKKIVRSKPEVTVPVGEVRYEDLIQMVNKDISSNVSYTIHLRKKLDSFGYTYPEDLFVTICMFINTFGGIRKTSHLNPQVKEELTRKLKEYGFSLRLPLINKAYDPLRISIRKR